MRTFCLRSLLSWSLVSLVAGSGCSGDSGISTTVLPTATPSPAATGATPSPVDTTASFPIASGGGTAALAASGYAGTLVYPGNTASTGVGTFSLSTTLSGAVPPPAPSGTQELYFTFSSTQSVSFVGGFEVTPVTVPLGVSVAPPLVETLYDVTTGRQIGFASGSLSGQTISFGSVSGTALAANAGDQYLFVISHG